MRAISTLLQNLSIRSPPLSIINQPLDHVRTIIQQAAALKALQNHTYPSFFLLQAISYTEYMGLTSRTITDLWRNECHAEGWHVFGLGESTDGTLGKYMKRDGVSLGDWKTGCYVFPVLVLLVYEKVRVQGC